MPDVSIVNTTVTPAPTDYAVPGTQELQLKAVRASIDGSGTASSWLPALQLLDPAGHVMWTAVDTSSSVAAGASADVSWFPGVRKPCPPNGWPNTNHQTTALVLGPWAYWPLDEVAGSASCADVSGHGRTITPQSGNVTLGHTGLVPTSSQTCSYSDYIAVNTANFQSSAVQTWTTHVVSVEYWINALLGQATHELDLGTMGTITGVGSRIWRCYLNSSGNVVMEYQTAGPVLNTVTFASFVYDGAAHQIVVTLDGTNLTCYIDAVQVDQQAQVAAMSAPLTSKVTLGGPTGGAGARFYGGFMGPVGWYDTVLSSTDVANLYAAATVI